MWSHNFRNTTAYQTSQSYSLFLYSHSKTINTQKIRQCIFKYGKNKEPVACQYAQLQPPNMQKKQKSQFRSSCTWLFYSNVSAVGRQPATKPCQYNSYMQSESSQHQMQHWTEQPEASEWCRRPVCSGLKRGGETSQWCVDGVQGSAVWDAEEYLCLADAQQRQSVWELLLPFDQRAISTMQEFSLYTFCFDYFIFCGSFFPSLCSDNFAA